MKKVTSKSTKSLLLPVEAYRSQEWFDREQKDLFGCCWQFAGMTLDIPDVGDYLCVQVGLYPLIVVRGNDQTLRAFHNICRHRGTQLLKVTGKGKKLIRCPYHNWVYSLDGALSGVPQQEKFSDINISTLGLHPAAVETWKGMIFVHPDPSPEPLMTWLAGFPEKFGPHQPEKLVEAEKYTYQVKANWKIFVENYIDGYHLAHLHSETLREYDHKNQEWSFVGRHWTFFEPLTKTYLDSLEKKSPLPIIDHIPREKIGAYVHMLFPNLGIVGTENTWMILHVIPVAPDQTTVEVRTWTMPISTMDYLAYGAWESFKSLTSKKTYLSLASYAEMMLIGTWFLWGSDDNNNKQENQNFLESGDVMLEDIYACEQQQKAMKSPKFGYSQLSEDESSIIDFQRHLLDYFPLRSQSQEG